MGTVVDPTSVLEQIKRARFYNPNFGQGAAPIAPQAVPQGQTSLKDQALAQYREALQQGQPSQSDYHPSVGRRILGALLGGTVGITNPQAGRELAHNTVYSPYDKSVSDYQKKLAQKKEAYETEEKATQEEAKLGETVEQKKAETARAGAEEASKGASEALRKQRDFETSPEGQAFELKKLGVQHPNTPKIPVPYELTLKNDEKVVGYEGQNGQFKDAEGNIYGTDAIKEARKVGTNEPKSEAAAKPPREGEAGAIDQWTQEHGRAPNYSERLKIHKDYETKPDTGVGNLRQEFQMQSAREASQRPHQRNLDLATSQLDRINRSISMVDTSKPEDIAIAIPEILTALVSGNGTGVRITQPEMNSIIKARGFGDSVEAFVNKIKGQGNLSTQQKSDLKSLLSDVQAKVSERQRDITDLMDKIDSAKNPEDLGKAQIEYRKKLTGGGKSDTKVTSQPKTKEDFLKLLDTK